MKATLHWVSAAHAAPARRSGSTIASSPTSIPDAAEGDFRDYLNPESPRRPARESRVEPSLAAAAPESRWQFERHGYFAVDPSSTPGHLVFNWTAPPLRDTWAKIEAKQRPA